MHGNDRHRHTHRSFTQAQTSAASVRARDKRERKREREQERSHANAMAGDGAWHISECSSAVAAVGTDLRGRTLAGRDQVEVEDKRRAAPLRV